MPNQKEKIDDKNKNIFVNNTEFQIGNLQIFPFSTPHDAANPCGFSIVNGHKKLSIATDLGHIEQTIFENLKDSSFILLESNYDSEVLKMSSYPYSLKQRICGPKGHLSNNDAGKTICALMYKNLKEVMLRTP